MLKGIFVPLTPLIVAVSLLTGQSAAAASHEAQGAPDFANMQTRLGQLVDILDNSSSCAAVEATLDLTLGLVYGGTRPLPTPIKPDEADGVTKQDIAVAERANAVNQVIAPMVAEVTRALQDLALGKRCPDQAGQAADLKFMLEEMEDVAAALSQFTAKCGVGDSLVDGPCAQLRPVLDEATGHIIEPGQDGVPRVIRAGFRLKLRSPFVPRWTRGWEEDVRLIPALAPGECSAVFKETKGLMLRLRLDGFTVVRDPWATPTLPRGTKIPIWTLEWVPSEYVKHFNICNRDGKIEHVTVAQRVKQDIPLNYFWRYFRK